MFIYFHNNLLFFVLYEHKLLFVFQLGELVQAKGITSLTLGLYNLYNHDYYAFSYNMNFWQIQVGVLLCLYDILMPYFRKIFEFI